MLRKIILAALFACTVGTIEAQKLNYFVEFSHFLDNREYSGNGDKYALSQTMLGARLNTMLGAKIDSAQGIMAGVNYLYEYGDKIDGNTPTINLFYHYQKDGLTGLLGSFPRRGLLDYPLALLCDSLDNYRPDIQGAYLETRGKWGYENFWCDWTGRQRTDVKESFLAGFSGRINLSSLLFFDHYFYMYHRALYAGHLEDDHIRDNGAFALLFGADFTRKTKLKELSFKLGTLGCYDRDRPDPSLHFLAGAFAQAHIYSKRFGIDASYYRGGKLRIVNGDGLYRSGDYGRVDFAFIPVENKYVSSRAAICFHITEGSLVNSQQLSLILKLGAFCKTYHDNLSK
ncbi:MAG: hypothetical protein H6Q17_1039 [Bacteroidetes bacterium]|nr:hypothetical protein [Bacteroidota bacterium]